MKKLLIVSALFNFSLFGCRMSDDFEERFNSVPYIVSDYSGVDTLRTGEIFSIKLWLSDTSILISKNPINEKIGKLYPAFFINDSIVFNEEKSYILDFSTIADSGDSENIFGNKQHRLGFVFPHPIQSEQLIRITKTFHYYLVDDGLEADTDKSNTEELPASSSL